MNNDIKTEGLDLFEDAQVESNVMVQESLGAVVESGTAAEVLTQATAVFNVVHGVALDVAVSTVSQSVLSAVMFLS